MGDSFNIFSLLEKNCLNHFYQSENETHTYKDFLIDIQNICLKLRPFSINKGERVALVIDDSYKSLVLLFALFALRGIPVLISNSAPQANLKERLTSIDCQKIISPDIVSLKRSASTDIILPEIDIEDDATIMFTSGTSSIPKAVLHTFSNHYYAALGSNKNILLTSDDSWLLSLPLHHIGGLAIIFRCILAGSKVISKNNSVDIFSCLGKMKISHFSLVDAQLKKLVETKQNCPGTVKAVLAGGGRISINTLKTAIALGYPVYNTYGMTEMSSQITSTTSSITAEQLTNSGTVLPYREIQLSAENEILVKGKTLCSGYLNAPFPIDDKGWFRTGDIGSIDSEGNLTITGRKDNLFISGGENIYPEEIEKVVKQIEGIIEAIVIPVDDSRFGHSPVLFYKAESNKKITEKYIYDHLKKNIEKFKLPKEIIIIPENYIQDGIKPNRKFLRDWLLSKDNH